MGNPNRTTTITVEDLPDGNVKITCTPNVQELISLTQRGAGLRSGEAYALHALRMIAEAAKKERGRRSGLILPPDLQ